MFSMLKSMVSPLADSYAHKSCQRFVKETDIPKKPIFALWAKGDFRETREDGFVPLDLAGLHWWRPTDPRKPVNIRGHSLTPITGLVQIIGSADMEDARTPGRKAADFWGIGLSNDFESQHYMTVISDGPFGMRLFLPVLVGKSNMMAFEEHRMKSAKELS